MDSLKSIVQNFEAASFVIEWDDKNWSGSTDAIWKRGNSGKSRHSGSDFSRRNLKSGFNLCPWGSEEKERIAIRPDLRPNTHPSPSSHGIKSNATVACWIHDWFPFVHLERSAILCKSVQKWNSHSGRNTKLPPENGQEKTKPSISGNSFSLHRGIFL